MVVPHICKNEEDLIKNEGARVLTRLYNIFLRRSRTSNSKVSGGNMISAFPIEKEEKKMRLGCCITIQVSFARQQVSSIPETHSASFCVCTASCASSTGRNPDNMCKYIVDYYRCMQIMQKNNGSYIDLVYVLLLYTFYP